MLVYPLEISQNRPLQNEEANMQDKSEAAARRKLRVAASFNKSFQRTVKKLRLLPPAEF